MPDSKEPVEILLIEDSEYDAELTFKAMKAKLPSINYLHLRDGQEALAYLFREDAYARRQPPLPLMILLDLDLPKLPGLHMLQKLKTNPATRGIPVVVWTVSKDPALMKQAYEAGANSYVIKPLSFVKFSLTVADIVFYWLVVNDLPGNPKNLE